MEYILSQKKKKYVYAHRKNRAKIKKLGMNVIWQAGLEIRM